MKSSNSRPALSRTRWARWRTGVQVVFLILALYTTARFLLVAGAPSVEAYCPFGGIETAFLTSTTGEYLRNLAPSNLIALGLTLVATVILGRVFCGWVCPVGTLQDGVAGIARRISGRDVKLPIQLPKSVDRALRWFKYGILAWVLWTSLTAFVPPLAPFCPYRTLFELNVRSMLSVGVVVALAVASLLIERFWCRYLCPLGAVLALFNWLSPVRPRVNKQACVACGRCAKACPAGIDPVEDGTEHPECVRCYACVTACRVPKAVRVGTKDVPK